MRRLLSFESLGILSIREIGEKLTIFAKMSVTKVRFFTQHCALLELLFELKHFSKKVHTLLKRQRKVDILKTDGELKEPKNLLNPESVAEPNYPRLSEFEISTDATFLTIGNLFYIPNSIH